MPKYRTSYGEVMTDMIAQHSKGKSQDFFIQHGDEAGAILEEEINGMSNSELIDLMEQTGIIRVSQEE